MSNNHQTYVQNCEKFIHEIIPAVIGNGDFSNYSHEGIIDFHGQIGKNISYHGIRGENCNDLGNVKNTNATTRVALSQAVTPHLTKALCYFEYKSSQWNYVHQTTLEKDELKHTILVKTPKALTSSARKIKDCGGYVRDGVEGILRVEYGKSEDPEKFLVNLFQTIENSQIAALTTSQPKKLHRLNIIAKLTHLINKHHRQEQTQEMNTTKDWNN